MSGPDGTAEPMPGPMAGPRECFEQLTGWLEGEATATLEHDQLEEQLDQRGRELLRQMLRGNLELRALREQRLTQARDADGTRHGCVEAGHERGLRSIFGPVRVSRLAYRHAGHANLYPADAGLNLPSESHSHGLRRLAPSRRPEDHSTKPAGRSGAAPANNCANARSRRSPPPHAPNSATRLSEGEKRNRKRKRLAEIGTVYDLHPLARTADVVLARADEPTDGPRAPTPRARNK